MVWVSQVKQKSPKSHSYSNDDLVLIIQRVHKASSSASFNSFLTDLRQVSFGRPCTLCFFLPSVVQWRDIMNGAFVIYSAHMTHKTSNCEKKIHITGSLSPMFCIQNLYVKKKQLSTRLHMKISNFWCFHMYSLKKKFLGFSTAS